jgi:hypothetical protein
MHVAANQTLSGDESLQTTCKTGLASNTDLLLVTLPKDLKSVREISGASTNPHLPEERLDGRVGLPCTRTVFWLPRLR